MPYRALGCRGHTFVFKTDPADAAKFHIVARHLTPPEDAIRVFFEAAVTRWNRQHDRFESYTDTHGLYWFWRDEARRVAMVISCFTI